MAVKQENTSKSLPTKNVGIAITFLFVILSCQAFLIIFNIDKYSSIGATHGLWFDEGVNAMVASNMATEGNYGLINARGGFQPFPDYVTTGPSVLLPIAASIKLLGDGIIPARIVMAIFLLLSVTVFYILTWWLYGWKAAIFASSFYITGVMGIGSIFPYEPVLHSRFVLGEVPGFLYTLLGVAFLGLALRAVQPKRQNVWLLLVGLSWGLAIQAKLMFALLIIIFVVWSILERPGWRFLIIPIVGIAVPGLSWLGYEFNILGHSAMRDRFLFGWPVYSSESAGLVNNVVVVVKRLSGMLGIGLVVFGVPALLFALWQSIGGQRNPRRSVLRFLVLFVIVWMSWFLVSTLYRPRHVLPPIFILNIFFAGLLIFLADNMKFPKVASIRENWRSALFWDRYLRQILILVFAILLIFAPGKMVILESIRDVEKSPNLVVAYLNREGGSQLSIAAGERELDYLIGFTFHHLNWTAEKLPDHLDYIICSSMSRVYIDCPPAGWEGSTIVYSIGPYEVYKAQLTNRDK